MDRSRRAVWISSLIGGALCALGWVTWTSWKSWRAEREYEQVRTFAARLANDEFEQRFDRRPFLPETYDARLVDDRWHWGGFEPADFFSTEVSFQRNGGDAQVRVFWASDGPAPVESMDSRFRPSAPQPSPASPAPYLIDK